ARVPACRDEGCCTQSRTASGNWAQTTRTGSASPDGRAIACAASTPGMLQLQTGTRFLAGDAGCDGGNAAQMLHGLALRPCLSKPPELKCGLGRDMTEAGDDTMLRKTAPESTGFASGWTIEPGFHRLPADFHTVMTPE